MHCKRQHAGRERKESIMKKPVITLYFNDPAGKR
jgi:hypothetical protein